MVRRRMKKTGSRSVLAFGVLCSAALLLGSLLGAFCTEDADPNAVRTVLSAESGAGGTLALTIAKQFGLQAAVFLLGLSVPGVYVIPVLGLVRGFLAGYSVSAAARTQTAGGFLYALKYDGAVLLATVPFFLAVSVLAMRASWGIGSGLSRSAGDRRRPFHPEGYLTLGGILFLLPAAILLLLSLLSR